MIDFDIKLQDPKMETYLTITLKGCTASPSSIVHRRLIVS